jgi:hypothetical protein
MFGQPILYIYILHPIKKKSKPFSATLKKRRLSSLDILLTLKPTQKYELQKLQQTKTYLTSYTNSNINIYITNRHKAQQLYKITGFIQFHFDINSFQIKTFCK